MPDTTTFGGDPIPTGPEGAWVPGSMMAFAESIDPKLVHAVANQADRDANFATLSAGHIVTWPAGNTVWMRTATGWLTVASDTGWITSGFGYPSANWSAGTYARCRNHNGIIETRVAVTYSGPTTAYPTGDVTNESVVTVPSAYRFDLGILGLTGYCNGVGVGMAAVTNGDIRIVNIPPGESLVNGSILNVSATWLEG